MKPDPDIQQRLLELVYGLLPDDEAAELRRQIADDEALAKAYEEAQATARLFAEASAVTEPKVPLSRPETPSTPASPRSRMSSAAKTPAAGSPTAKSPKKAAASSPSLHSKGSHRNPWARSANWTVAIVAVLLLMVSVGSYIYHREQLNVIAAEHLRVLVAGPAQIQKGIDNTFTIDTMTIDGKPASADVEFALLTPDGHRLLGHNESTDKNGRLQVVVPADMELPGAAVLKVVTTQEDRQQAFEAQVEVAPERYDTQLAVDKPLYRPGETVYYRSLTLSRFGMTADRAAALRYEILDPSGAAVPDSQLEGVTERGVGNGSFVIGDQMAGGEYVLVARSVDDSFPEARRPFFVRRYRLPRLKKELEFARDSYGPGDEVVADFLANRAEGGPAADAKLRILASVDGQNVLQKETKADDNGGFQVKFTLPKQIERGDGQLAVVVDDGGTRETIAKTIPINLGTVDVAFYPEGGDLVPSLENRVYFVARDPLGEPVHIEGVVVNSDDAEVALVETTHEGMGRFSFIPRAEKTYRLRITSPADVGAEPELPKVSATQQVTLNTGTGVFAANEPLEFNLRSAKADLPLVVSAWCRGVLVGQQALVTLSKGNGANSVAIALAEGVGGVIRLTVHDFSADPPRPIAERLVYRRLNRKLKVEATTGQKQYAPGDKVEISLRVTDEEGRPVPATLGVSVVDDALLNLADDDTASMPTQFLLTSEIEKPEDLEDADFYLSDDPEAARALDLLLGTQGWRRFAEVTAEEFVAQNAQGAGAERGKAEEGRAEDASAIDTEEQLARLVATVGPGGPPLVFDNLGELRTQYDDSLAEYEAQRSRALDTLITVSFFGGLGLVLLVAMLGLLKIVTGVQLWMPAVGVTVCCLIIGAILMDPSRLSPGTGTAVAFLSLETAEDEEADEAGDRSGLADDAAKEMVGEKDEKLREERKKMPEGGEVVLGEAEAKPEGWNRVAQEKPTPPAKPMPVVMEPAPELAKEEIANERLADGKGAFRRDMKLDALLRVEKQLADREDLDFYGRAEFRKRLADYRFTVRQYAHTHRAGPPGVRTDFAETLFWHPLLIADADGTAKVNFELSDSITTFRLKADAHVSTAQGATGQGTTGSSFGRLGTGTAEIVSRIPFNMEPKLPLEVTAGDRIELPLAVVNDSLKKLPVEVRLQHGDLVALDGAAKRRLEMAAGKRVREYFALDVTGQKGECALTFEGTAGNLADAVSRKLRVVPPGFPKQESYSGQLDGERQIVVELPERWVEGSLEVTLSAFPSTLADLQQGMDSILREPCGCFEQASTSNYPNALTLKYLEEHEVAAPAVTRRAKDLLKKGYTKLVGYESPKQGYEWFGGDPGHEALTAYGLMEFRDMADVYDVDPEMLNRTAQWLLERRDGKGGFQRNPRALDSFGQATKEITDAYIVWALSESKQEGIDKEVDYAVALADKSDDPYLIALVASAAATNADKKPQAEKLLEKLAKAQDDDGHLEGRNGSITRSGGQSLKVETTALAALAWLKMPSFGKQANKAVEWIIQSRSGAGGFGSTQATILALKALTEHAKANRRTVSEGKLIVRRDDVTLDEHPFGAGQQETIVIEGLEANLRSGENRLTVDLTGDNHMPYALDVSYRTEKPPSDADCPVRLTTKLETEKVKAGETVALDAKLTNTSDNGQPMTVAILGLPAGLEPRAEQLQELKKAGTIDYYETRAREVICYWRSLAPKKEVTVKLDLIAAVPGKYTAPASRAYLYYTAEQKQWVEPLKVEIVR